MPKFIEVPTNDFIKTTKELEAARKVVKLASEFCAAIDLAEEDIGGARPAKTILRDLGRSLNVYDRITEKQP